MENRHASTVTHEEACARVAALFPPHWLQHYVGAKLRRDTVFRTANELLQGSTQPLLDIGCGIGLLPFYLRERGFRPTIAGYDIDGRKIRQAREVIPRECERVTFVEHDLQHPLPKFQGHVALFDVLHYLPPGRQVTLLRELATRVAPGAFFLIRDCPRDRSARFWITYAAELFAQATSWNLGVRLHFPTSDSIRAPFSPNEFSREERCMAGGGPFNNRLFIFRRIADAPRVSRAVAPARESQNDNRARSTFAASARGSAG
jgi:SAM-dependent methyltransferase